MKTTHGSGHSIRYFLTLSYTLFVLVGLSIVGLAWFARQDEASDDALLLQIEERARLMASINQFEDIENKPLQTPETTTALNQALRVLYITPNLQIQRLSDLDVSADDQKIALQLAQQAMDGGYTIAKKNYPDRWGGYDELFAAAPVFNTDHRIIGAVCLILPMDEFRGHMNLLRMDLLLFASGLALIGLLLGFGFSSMFTRPMDRAGKMAASVAQGDYNIQLPLQGPTELVHLADNLNRMAQELEKQDRLRRQVLSSVTHELARPLGALRIGVDSLTSGAIQDPELADDLLQEMRLTLDRMEALVDDLELAALPQEIPVALDLRPLDLGHFLRQVCGRYQRKAKELGIHLSLNLPDESLFVQADDLRMNQVVGNLLDNAFKFTPSGGAVEIRAFRLESVIEIQISDNGIGIPPDDLQSVFKPYFQGANREMINRGIGLGLSIVRQLVEAHGGQVRLENRPDHGTIARVWLPSAPL